MNRDDLKPLIIEALSKRGGKAHHLQIAKYVWDHYEAEIRASGEMLYQWQYELRWAANSLRRQGNLKEVTKPYDGIWEIQNSNH